MTVLSTYVKNLHWPLIYQLHYLSIWLLPTTLTMVQHIVCMLVQSAPSLAALVNNDWPGNTTHHSLPCPKCYSLEWSACGYLITVKSYFQFDVLMHVMCVHLECMLCNNYSTINLIYDYAGLIHCFCTGTSINRFSIYIGTIGDLIIVMAFSSTALQLA